MSLCSCFVFLCSCFVFLCGCSVCLCSWFIQWGIQLINLTLALDQSLVSSETQRYRYRKSRIGASLLKTKNCIRGLTTVFMSNINSDCIENNENQDLGWKKECGRRGQLLQQMAASLDRSSSSVPGTMASWRKQISSHFRTEKNTHEYLSLGKQRFLSVYFVLHHNSQVNKPWNIQYNNSHATSPEHYFSLMFYYLQITYTLLRCSYVYRRTYTHAHTEALSLSFQTHWKAQRTNQYIHTQVSQRENSCNSTHLYIHHDYTDKIIIAICVQRGHSYGTAGFATEMTDLGGRQMFRKENAFELLKDISII